MNLHINKYNKSTEEKLRQLKSKNPKDFWNIINSLEKSWDNNSIDIETLYDLFKTLNEYYEDNEQKRQYNIDIDVSDDDEFLN